MTIEVAPWTMTSMLSTIALPMAMTISISFAPASTARRASATLADVTIAPSGKELVLRISNTLQLENGKVLRSYVYYDRLSLLKQLDLIVPGL